MTNVTKNSNFEEVLIEVITLNRQMNELKEKLDSAKEKIRDAAKKQRKKTNNDEQIIFECSMGKIAVAFVRDKIKLLGGTEPMVDSLRSELGEALWENLFEQVVVLAESIEDTLLRMPKGQANMVKKLLEWKPQEPRITIPK